MHFRRTTRHTSLTALLTIVLLLSQLFGFNAESVSDNTPKWYLGKDLDSLDSFTYKICTNHVIPSVNDSCIIVKLEFIDKLYGWNGAVWIVQAKFASSESVELTWQDAILQIRTDGGFSVASDPQHRSLSSIITKTLFWMNAYTSKDNSQDLKLGSYWGDVMSHRLYVSSIDIKTINEIPVEVITVGYQGGQKQSQIQIVDGFPFPIHATVYRPLGNSVLSQLQYEFQLLDYEPLNSKSSKIALNADDPSELESNSLSLDPQDVALFISSVCQIDLTTYGVDQNVVDLCNNAMLEPVYPYDAVYNTGKLYGTHDRNLCTGDLGDEMCYSGIVTMVDNSAIIVDGQTVRLSLVNVGLDEESQSAAYSYLKSTCRQGLWVTVDIDDLQPLDTDSKSVGIVYCQDDTPVNAMLIEQNLASIDQLQCDQSEFAAHNWTAHMCDP